MCLKKTISAPRAAMAQVLCYGFLLGLSACVTQPTVSDNASGAGTAASSSTTTSKSEKGKSASAAEKNCRMVKGKEDYEGLICGNPPAKSKFSKLTIGMTQYQVEKLLGHPQDLKYVTNWRKAWIPFYGGTDARRLVWLYEGQGKVMFDTDSAYAEGGRIVEIDYDPKIEL